MMKGRRSFGVATVLGVIGFATGCSIELDVESASGPVVGTYAPLVAAAAPAYDSHCSPAPALMRSAVCVCNELSVTGSLRTIGRRGQPADVGVGGDVSLASGSFIDGSLRSSGEVSSAGQLGVAHHLWARDGVDITGSLEVGGDLASGGDLGGAGDLTVGGLLRVAGDHDWAGSEEIGGHGAYDAPAAAPCGCDAASIYDVAKAVAVAREKHDNILGNMKAVGSSEITLSSGRYYVASLASVGDLRVRVEGDVQLYVDGDVETIGDGRFSIAKGGSLDLFVAGSVHSVGEVSLGDPGRPEAFRLYVGGRGSEISITGSSTWSGLVYAPTSHVSITGDTEIRGALVVGSLDKTGSLVVRGARVTSYGDRCEAKPVVAPKPAPNAPAEQKPAEQKPTEQKPAEEPAPPTPKGPDEEDAGAPSPDAGTETY